MFAVLTVFPISTETGSIGHQKATPWRAQLNDYPASASFNGDWHGKSIDSITVSCGIIFKNQESRTLSKLDISYSLVRRGFFAPH